MFTNGERIVIRKDTECTIEVQVLDSIWKEWCRYQKQEDSRWSAPFRSFKDRGAGAYMNPMGMEKKIQTKQRDGPLNGFTKSVDVEVIAGLKMETVEEEDVVAQA